MIQLLPELLPLIEGDVTADIGVFGKQGEFAQGIIEFKVDTVSIGEDAVEFCARIKNISTQALEIERIACPQVRLSDDFTGQRLWSMQGISVGWGQDFAFPLETGFERENFLGHLQDGEGGGIPVVYFWNKSLGLALMISEPTPQQGSMPVRFDQGELTFGIEYRTPTVLESGAHMDLPRFVISKHKGDFFAPLDLYRQLLADRDVQAPKPTEGDYDAAWCSWGYEFDVNAEEMTSVLPKLKEMGICWLTLDDRWFDTYGDWNPRTDTFPDGERDFIRMNEQIHAEGCFSQLWWYPLCAEDGHGEWESHKYIDSRLLTEHPDWVILNEDGPVARNNRHLAILCPALSEVQQYTHDLTIKFIQDWGFDGHKLDNIYTIPPCYNPAHSHKSPEESTLAMGTVYQDILATTRAIKPNSVTQICPCGSTLSLQWTRLSRQTRPPAYRCVNGPSITKR